ISRASIVIGLVLALAWVVQRQSAQLARTWQEYAEERAPKREALELVADLTVSDEIVVERSDRRLCDGLLGRDVLDDCEEGDQRHAHGQQPAVPADHLLGSVAGAAQRAERDLGAEGIGDPGPE